MAGSTPAGQAEGRNGVVVRAADGAARLEFRRTWLLDADHVWAALTEPERLARWIGTYDGPRAPGGSGIFTMTFEGQAPGERLRIVDCEVPRRLVVEWPDKDDWRIEIVLTAQRGGTTLLFAQQFADSAGIPDVATGWHWYLDKLDAEVTGRPQPSDWDAFAAEVGPAYGYSTS